MAQDTGSAITGAVRADYFWGWGDEAEAAGRPHEAAAAPVGALAERVAADTVTRCRTATSTSMPTRFASGDLLRPAAMQPLRPIP